MRLLYYRHKAFPTQIFWKLLVVVLWLYHGSSTLSTPPQRAWGLLLHKHGNCLQINHKK